MDKEKSKKAIYTLMFSSFLVSIYAILQRLGIDKDIWIQDVQDRVFSTLGQPNWLAAFLVAATPLTWALLLNSKRKTSSGPVANLKLITLSSLLFLTILFTKSRSGLIGFVFADFVFWIPVLIYYFVGKIKIESTFRTFIALHLVFFVITASIGTPWSHSVFTLIKQPTSEKPSQTETMNENAVEGLRGPESGKIRLIVWQGAYDIFKSNPLIGTGVETFAYSYYKHKPKEHNLTSEWDFLYNKAHNEYLNFAATTGVLGLSSYLLLIVASLFQIINYQPARPAGGFPISKQAPHSKGVALSKFKLSQLEIKSVRNYKPALLAGYISLLVSNFFGFSVTSTALLFFLYPALVITLEVESKKSEVRSFKSMSGIQKAGILLTLLITLYLLLITSLYWYADFLYAKGRSHNSAGDYQKAQGILYNAIGLSPNEPSFWAELAESKAEIAIEQFESKEYDLSAESAKSSVRNLDHAVSLSPNNVNVRKNKARVEITLSELDSNYLFSAIKTLTEAVELAPSDAKIHYNLAIAYLKTGEVDKAIRILKKTIDLKSNYKDARFALAVIQDSLGNYEEAATQLEYILNYIDPDDEQVILKLNQIRKK
jgi:O-antigen ligase/thioredoxin-like negative regulator of GroEL